MKRLLIVPAFLLFFLNSVLAQWSGSTDQANAEAASGQVTGSFGMPSTDYGTASNPLLGGIPQHEPISGVLTLSLSSALQRGLRYNLGALLSEQSVLATRSTRILALSQLLPRLTAGIFGKAAAGKSGCIWIPGIPRREINRWSLQRF